MPPARAERKGSGSLVDANAPPFEDAPAAEMLALIQPEAAPCGGRTTKTGGRRARSAGSNSASCEWRKPHTPHRCDNLLVRGGRLASVFTVAGRVRS